MACPSKPSAEHPKVLNWVPTPLPSTSAVDIPGMLNLVPRPQSTFPPADLPVFSSVAPSPQPFTAPLHHDGPLTIHNHSVEEYQKLYHEVVDDMGKSLLLTSLQSDNYHILLKNLSLDFSIYTIFNLTL